jgi:hypothetical protein
MLADCSWEVAVEAISIMVEVEHREWKKYATNTRQIRNALRLVNAASPQLRLKTLPRKHIHDSRLQEKVARWNLVPDNSLVKIKKPLTGNWHWVCLRIDDSWWTMEDGG